MDRKTIVSKMENIYNSLQLQESLQPWIFVYISILGKGAEKKAAPKKEQPKKETPKKVEKEEEPPAPKEKKDPYADFPKPWVLQHVIYSDRSRKQEWKSVSLCINWSSLQD